MTDKEAVEALLRWIDTKGSREDLHRLCSQIKRDNPKAYTIVLNEIRKMGI